jgi:hypothetical protein
VKIILALLMLGGCLGMALAQPPSDPSLFQAGLFGDDDRTVTCNSGQPCAVFSQKLWAWVPDDLGLAYITLRFDFPDNLDLSAHPTFHPLVSGIIITRYPGGTVEWNMIFSDCPSGWILVFEQPCVLLDDQPAKIGILDGSSMVRDCEFVLNGLVVLNNFGLNDPGCATVPTRTTTWGGVKSLYR